MHFEDLLCWEAGGDESIPLKMGKFCAIVVTIPMGVFVTAEVVFASNGGECTTWVFTFLVVSTTNGGISITKQGGVSSPPIDKWEVVSILSSNLSSLSTI